MKWNWGRRSWPWCKILKRLSEWARPWREDSRSVSVSIIVCPSMKDSTGKLHRVLLRPHDQLVTRCRLAGGPLLQRVSCALRYYPFEPPIGDPLDETRRERNIP